MILGLVIDLAFIVSSYMQLSLLKGVQSGMMVTDAEANANDMRHLGIALLSVAVNIGCIITFIMWFRRGYFNLHQRVNNLDYSEGWAAGAWFVPFLNLWRPVQIMSEMNRETQDLLVKEKLMEPKKLLGFLIPTWWTLWLLDRIVGGMIQRAQMRAADAQTLEDLITETNTDLILTYAAIPLTIVTILMIRTYSKMEDLLPLVNTTAAERPVLSDGDLLDR